MMRVLICVGLVLLMAGCAASDAKIAQNVLIGQTKADARHDAKKNLEAVAPHVHTEHVDQCKRLLEAKPLLGGEPPKVLGKFVGSVRHTCFVLAQGLRSLLTGAQGIGVFVAPVEYTTIFGKKRKRWGACTFTLTDGKISVSRAPTKGPAMNGCHYI